MLYHGHLRELFLVFIALLLIIGEFKTRVYSKQVTT